MNLEPQIVTKWVGDYDLDTTAAEALIILQKIVDKHSPEALVYVDDGTLSVTIKRLETEEEVKYRLQAVESQKKYRYDNYLRMKKEFEPDSVGDPCS
jgi:hypothetical protein